MDEFINELRIPEKATPLDLTDGLRNRVSLLDPLGILAEMDRNEAERLAAMQDRLRGIMPGVEVIPTNRFRGMSTQKIQDAIHGLRETERQTARDLADAIAEIRSRSRINLDPVRETPDLQTLDISRLTGSLELNSTNPIKPIDPGFFTNNFKP